MVKFIVDSTFGISEGFAKENDIRKVDLTIELNGKHYLEGYSEQWEEFYTDYVGQKKFALTSQPSPKAFMDAIDSIDKSDDIIILTIGDRLSGTVGSANIAAMQYPDRNISVINTGSAAVAAFLILRELVELSKSGADLNTVLDLSKSLITRTSINFIPVSLSELAHGGRVNKLMFMLGTAIKVRPILRFAENDITVASRHLGIKKALSAAVSSIPEFDKIALCYIYDNGNIAIIKDKIQEKYGLSDIEVFPVCPVLGAHIGVGTVGIATVGKLK